MADGLDLSTIMRQLVQEAGSGAPGALQAASEGDRQASDLQRQRLNEGENFYRNYNQGRVNLPLLSGFGAMMAPTKTGSFSESLSNAIGSGAGALQKQRSDELDRFGKLQAIQDARAKLAAADGSMKLQQLQRGLGMVGGLDAAQGVIANSDLEAALAKMRSGASVASNAPASPVSGLTPLVQPTVSGPSPAPSMPSPSADASAPSPFGTLPATRPGTPPFPIDHGAVTSTPPGMNLPQGVVIGGDSPTPTPSAQTPPMPNAPPMPAAQAPAMPSPSPAVAVPSPAMPARPAAPAAASSDDPAYAGEPINAADMQKLQQAYQLKALAQQNSRAPKSAAIMQQADAVIKSIVPQNWRFDPSTQRLVPTGEKSIAYQTALEAGKQKAKATSPDDTFNTEAAKKQAESFQKVADELPNARARAAQVEALSASLDKLPGGFKGWMQQMASNYGLKLGDYATNVEAAQALVSQLLPSQRQGMPGAVSDRDMAIFKSALPQLMNTPDGNKIIVGTMKMLSDYSAKQSELAAQALNGDITRQEAAKQMREMGVPIKETLSRIGNAGKKAPAQQGGQTSVPSPDQREMNKVYAIPGKGSFRWMGNGWLPAN